MFGAAAIGASAQTYVLNLKFEGDSWDKAYVSNQNQPNPGDWGFDVFYSPTQQLVEYGFEMPFKTDVNTPGLLFGVTAGYSIKVALQDDGKDLRNGTLDSGADYQLGGDGGAGFFSAAEDSKRGVAGLDRFPGDGMPNLTMGTDLSIYSAKMDGATFVITVDKVQGPSADDGVTFDFAGIDWTAEPAVLGMTINYTTPPGTTVEPALLLANRYLVTYGNSTRVMFNTVEDDYKINITSPDMEEGSDTYKVTETPGKYFGTVWYVDLYAGAKGKSIKVTHGDVQEPGDTTGVTVTEDAPEAEVYFDLQGRRVEKPVKGIYIVNGSKRIVR